MDPQQRLVHMQRYYMRVANDTAYEVTPGT